MKLFFDEDMGKGIPLALRALGFNELPNRVDFVRRRWKPHVPVPDELWIPWAGDNEYMVVSCNKAILETEAQRELLITHQVGIVFIMTGQERNVAVLQLMLRKWSWLETIERSEKRPFAYLLPLLGKPKRDPRVQWPIQWSASYRPACGRQGPPPRGLLKRT